MSKIGISQFYPPVSPALGTAILLWTSVLAPQTCRSEQLFDSIWKGPHLRRATKPVQQSNNCVHGWMSCCKSCKQEWRTGCKQTGFGFQKATNPSFQADLVASQPLRLQLLQFGSNRAQIYAASSRSANNKGHCPPNICVSSAHPDSCSWHKPDLTKLDQAGKTVRGKQLWGNRYGVKVMGKDLGRRKLLILLISFNILYIYVAVVILFFRRK